ncbi:MAG: glycosyltransferase [Candidatus Moraniibacteriota bacterium]
MNIAIFTNNYLPNPYGVTTSIESFRREFEKAGHTVYIFAPHFKNYKDQNKKVFRYPSFDINYKISFPLPIPFSFELEKKIQKLKIDIIHAQHPNLLGSVALHWAKKKKIPIVFTWHTIYDKYTHYTPFFPQKFSAHWIIGNSVRYANRVDKIIVPTDSVKKIIQKWGVKNKNIETVPTGVDEDNFKDADGKRIRQELGIEDDKKIILSISRLTEEKNVIFLIEEVVKSLKNNPEAVFVLGGEGYLKEKLIQTVNRVGVGEQVFFVGLIPRNEIKDYMDLADIFVYASQSETQGTIITEAMYMGLPIVALDSLGVGDLLEDKRTAFLVSEKEKNFSARLNQALSQEEKARKIGENAQAEALKKYTDRVCASRMLELYRKLINN